MPTLPQDITLNFRTAYMDSRGFRVSDPRMIARNYRPGPPGAFTHP